MELEIIYEDKQIIICNKPAGIPVQSARIGIKDMVSILKNYRNEKENLTGEPYLGLVHRLDQPVQGVMVFAKTKEAAAELSRQVSDGRMKKQYLAVVCGKPSEQEGTLVDYLLKDGKTNTSKIVKEGTRGAKKAILSYRVVREFEDRTLVEVDLKTGRHHQIRVQMAGAKMPLLGDRKYNREAVEENVPTVALAAYRLSFVHPKTKKVMTFEQMPKGPVFDNFRQ